MIRISSCWWTRDTAASTGSISAGQFGKMHAIMRRALPKACYIGFTGTPLKKREKNTARQFGGMIDTYTIDQAVRDKAVRRLLYEGRLVEQEVSKKQIDAWFDRLTRNRTKEEKAELKKKFATAGHLHKAEERMRMVAWDVSCHFDERFKGIGLKGQACRRQPPVSNQIQAPSRRDRHGDMRGRHLEVRRARGSHEHVQAGRNGDSDLLG